ncbi:hypothetical protein [Streptomyces sp. NBC_01198]|uniref:hypothetical protein n=1 Tax=Streptomyces sp. NBC_01198 TaxID=2903769 RepID=UPI002E0D1323|nr:hypothetical protein OG702_20965 [Streptomyces sp. NBC_01198]
MSFEAEWARIKQEVSAEPVSTLAHADVDAVGSGGVASDAAAWKAAAQGVGTLAENLSKAGGKLYEAQQGMDTSHQSSAGTFETLAAQAALHPTWSGYVSSLLGRCAALKQQLAAAGATLGASDDVVKSEFDALDDDYQDTPAVGGQSQAG